MSRVAKHDFHAAFDKLASNIKNAAGKDGVISRNDMKNALPLIEDAVERKATDMFARFSDHRDAKKGARLTGSDVDKTLKYAKEHLVDPYDNDKPNNGFSKKEISLMSTTAQLAAIMAKQNKAK